MSLHRFYSKKTDAKVPNVEPIRNTNNVDTSEVQFVQEQLSRDNTQRSYEKISLKIKMEIARFAEDKGSSTAAIKFFSEKYPKIILKRQTVNDWRKNLVGSDFRHIGQPCKLDENLESKITNVIIGTRQAGAVISRASVISIGTGVVKANDPSLLAEFGGSVKLTEKWARCILKELNFTKRKATTGKIMPSPVFLSETKFDFQRKVAQAIVNHDIIPEMVINLDQTPLSYINCGKYSFASKNTNNVAVKGVDDKRQITGTFAISLTGDFLPIQLIYASKTKRSLPKFDFPSTFNITYTPNHWANVDTCREFFEKIIKPYLQKIRQDLNLNNDRKALIIFDVFKGQFNQEIMKS